MLGFVLGLVNVAMCVVNVLLMRVSKVPELSLVAALICAAGAGWCWALSFAAWLDGSSK